MNSDKRERLAERCKARKNCKRPWRGFARWERRQALGGTTAVRMREAQRLREERAEREQALEREARRPKIQQAAP